MITPTSKVTITNYSFRVQGFDIWFEDFKSAQHYMQKYYPELWDLVKVNPFMAIQGKSVTIDTSVIS